MSDKPKSIGALWVNESKNNKKYMAGQIEIDGKTTKIIVFKNNYKETDNQPDYRIFEQTPKGESNSQSSQESTSNEQQDSADNEELPF